MTGGSVMVVVWAERQEPKRRLRIRSSRHFLISLRALQPLGACRFAVSLRDTASATSASLSFRSGMSSA